MTIERAGILAIFTITALTACTRRSDAVGTARDLGETPGAGPLEVVEAGMDATSSYPVPVRAVPAEQVQPGTPVNLQPTNDCNHPEVKAECEDGFCRIPPGCFIMGSPRDRLGAGRYVDVQVQVTLTQAFEVAEAELTNAQWLEAGFELPSRDVDVARCNDADCPISNVNFYETLTFLNRYSELRGLEPCYELRNCTGTFGSGPVCNRHGDSSGNVECDRTEDDGLVCDGPFLTQKTPYLCEGYRLPTEAEWEYAARAGTRSATWLGNIAWREQGTGCAGPNPNLDPIAWYCWNSGDKVRPGKQKKPNPWGLYDILGNVSEWTNTTLSYGGYGEGPLVDPVGYWYDTFGYEDRNLFPIALDEQVLTQQDHATMRGGNALLEAEFITSEKRVIFADAYQGASVLGFRMVRTLF